jgi:hypothetical protein
MPSDPNPSPVPVPEHAPGSRPRFWKTALLLTSSAAFGGLAVAFWNRRALVQMRNEKTGLPAEKIDRSEFESTEEEIF